jgi:tetraacyldisaccharide 4'-kinase
MAFKRVVSKAKYYGVPVISIGNLLVGGTGKTPVTIALAKKYPNSAVVLRGYGRKSKGLYIVSKKGKIQTDVHTSGDEAMVLADALSQSTIIVSEDRALGIQKAKELGCETVFLDDGFTKYDIFKLDILLRPKEEPTNLFCLPSGGYRDTKMMYSFADMVLKEGEDFKRVVTLKQNGEVIKLDQNQKSIVVTAISKPQRLLEFLPKGIEMVGFADHYGFTQNDIDTILKNHPDSLIITTQKDYVKLKEFKLKNIILMDLDIEFSDRKVFEKIDKYIQQSKTV